MIEQTCKKRCLERDDVVVMLMVLALGSEHVGGMQTLIGPARTVHPAIASTWSTTTTCVVAEEA